MPKMDACATHSEINHTYLTQRLLLLCCVKSPSERYALGIELGMKCAEQPMAAWTDENKTSKGVYAIKMSPGLDSGYLEQLKENMSGFTTFIIFLLFVIDF